MSDNKQIKIPPHSFEAEQSVVGSLLLDNTRWDVVAELVTEADFYSRPHRVIFKAQKAILENGDPLDLLTLSHFLEDLGIIDEIGGFAYIADIAKNTPSAANVAAYAKIVADHASIRGLISTTNDIADICYNREGRSASDIADEAESKIFAVTESQNRASTDPKSVKNVMEQTLEKLELLYQRPNDGVTGVDTGYLDLNKKTAGLQDSDLVIVAGRPSMGKTTFAVNLCENAAMTEPDKTALIFSLEMPAEQLMMRMYASHGRIDQTRIRTGQLSDEDWARLSSVTGELMTRNNIVIDDNAGLTPTELRAKARKVARESKGGLSMIMVDYLQLMRVPSLSDNRTLEVGEISRSLKALAKELKVPVVALSQLNRSLEQRADKRPVNSDLRESGSIEQDADLIMFVYRDEVYNPDSPYKGTAEIIIGKQRNGPIGSVRLSFVGQYSRFENYTGASFDMDD